MVYRLTKKKIQQIKEAVGTITMGLSNSDIDGFNKDEIVYDKWEESIFGEKTN